MIANARKSWRYQRAVPWLALLGMIGLVLAGFSMAVYEEHLYQDQRVREVRSQAEILAASMTAALAFDDKKAAEEYVNPIRVNSDLEAAGAYLRDGKLIAGFSRTGKLPAHVQANDFYNQQGSLIITVPVTQDNTRIGTVYMRAVAEPMSTRIIRYGILALLVVMAVLMLGVLGNSQVTLANANQTLEDQARELAGANARLQTEMAEREKVEEALRQSQKMEAIGLLSGGIAHDFNNLLMIIKGNLHFLQRRKDLEPAAARHVEAAIEGANRAAVLTQRVLAFSRKQSLSPVELDINMLIAGMTDLIRNSAGENIEIVEDLHSSWPVTCDVNQTENVILNLVNNARDAMPGGGRLVLGTENEHVVDGDGYAEDVAAGDYVKIVIRDNGTGMSQDVRSKALDPFFTTKPPGQGTGLGLSTAFGFIRQSGGYMDIETAPGKGTAITILLPRSSGSETSAQA
jgi:signal transduction histidine kinase